MGFIYWIASYPHSGSSQTRAVLASLVAGGLKGDLNLVPEIVPDATIGQFYQRFLSVPIDDATSAELATARPHAHRLMAQKTQNFLFLNTHTTLATHYGTLTITANATAGAVYLVRNPLDVVVSLAAPSHRSIDQSINDLNTSQQELARRKGHAYEVTGSWSENVTSWTGPNDRVLTVRDEDIASEPIAAYRKIVDFLKMDVSVPQLAAAIADVPAQLSSGRSGLWEDQLSEEQVARIVGPNAEAMQRHGYWRDDFDALVDRHGSAGHFAPQQG